MTEPRKADTWWTRPSELIKLAGVLIAIGWTLQQMQATASVVHELQANQREMELWRAEHQAAQDAAQAAEVLRIRDEVRRLSAEGGKR